MENELTFEPREELVSFIGVVKYYSIFDSNKYIGKLRNLELSDPNSEWVASDLYSISAEELDQISEKLKELNSKENED